MHLPPWFWYSAIVLLTWGIVGLLQKLSTNQVSAESAAIWMVVGYILLSSIFYQGRAMLGYSARSLTYILVSSVLNTVGTVFLLAAMKHGGKAAIIVPFTALYPLAVALAAPFLLHESITFLQGIGVACALIAVVLLST